MEVFELDVSRSRAQIGKSAELNAVRAEIDALLSAAGGVASVDELGAQLLSLRSRTASRRRVSTKSARAAIFSQKTESDLTRSSSQRLGDTRKAKGVSSQPHHVCYWGQLGSERFA